MAVTRYSILAVGICSIRVDYEDMCIPRASLCCLMESLLSAVFSQQQSILKKLHCGYFFVFTYPRVYSVQVQSGPPTKLSIKRLLSAPATTTQLTVCQLVYNWSVVTVVFKNTTIYDMKVQLTKSCNEFHSSYSKTSNSFQRFYIVEAYKKNEIVFSLECCQMLQKGVRMFIKPH